MTDYLYDLTTRIHEINEKSGFNEYAATPYEQKSLYIGNKLMLVASELAEAQDEIRTGHAVAETYYVTGEKPEGFPSEIADAVIRLLSLARELDIDLPAIIEEKVAYNATRPFKHGKAF